MHHASSTNVALILRFYNIKFTHSKIQRIYLLNESNYISPRNVAIYTVATAYILKKKKSQRRYPPLCDDFE